LDERLPAPDTDTIAAFRDIAERAIARLETLAAEHRRRAEADDPVARFSFDASVEGERLRRYQFSYSRTLFRSIDTFLKVRRSGVAATGGDDPIAAQPGFAQMPVDPGAAKPAADRDGPSNGSIDPPIDGGIRQDGPAEDFGEQPAEMIGSMEAGAPTRSCWSPAFRRNPIGIDGPAEAGTPTRDPVRPLGDPPSGEIASGPTDRSLIEPANACCATAPDEAGMPQSRETADNHRPPLRATIVPLTLALDLLAGALAHGRGEPQNEPGIAMSEQRSLQDEAGATCDRVVEISHLEAVGERSVPPHRRPTPGMGSVLRLLASKKRS
jgi:hypothetical protein